MSKESYSTRFSDIQELQAHIGNEIGLSDWLQIEQKNIDAFAKATLDFQWIHTDPEVAKLHSPYGTTIAHGFLILSLAPKLIYETFHIDNAIMGVNYGLDRVRFPQAVVVDAFIRARVLLKEVESKTEGAKLTFSISIEVKGEEKPACVAEMITLVITQETEAI